MRDYLNIRTFAGLAGWGAVIAFSLCAAPALAATTTRAEPLAGPGSVGGYWASTTVLSLRAGPVVGGTPSFRTSAGQPIPLLPSVARIVADRRLGRDGGKPFPDSRLPCLTPGMPAEANPAPANPFEMVESPEQVSVLLGYYRNYRIIRMNTDHPANPEPAFMGDSVGRWDRGVLVVDTVAVRTETSILGLIPHSDQLHIIEKVRRTGRDTMESRMTIEDPKTFSKPWTMILRFRKSNISNVPDYACGIQN